MSTVLFKENIKNCANNVTNTLGDIYNFIEYLLTDRVRITNHPFYTRSVIVSQTFK